MNRIVQLENGMYAMFSDDKQITEEFVSIEPVPEFLARLDSIFKGVYVGRNSEGRGMFLTSEGKDLTKTIEYKIFRFYNQYWLILWLVVFFAVGYFFGGLF